MEVAKAILQVAAESNGGRLPELPITFGKPEVTKLEHKFIAKYGFGFFKWLTLDTYNLIVHSLPNRDIFISPYIQVPPQIQRQLALEALQNLNLIRVVEHIDTYFCEGWLTLFPGSLEAQADVVVWDSLVALARYSHFVPPNWIVKFTTLSRLDTLRGCLHFPVGEKQTEGTPPAFLRVFCNDLVKFVLLRLQRFFYLRGRALVEPGEVYPEDGLLLPRRYRKPEVLKKSFSTWRRRALPGHTMSLRDIQQALQLWAKLSLPVFLASVYTGMIRCTSLPDSSLCLLLPTKSPPLSLDPHRAASQAQLQKEESPNLDESQGEIVESLREAFVQIRNERKYLPGTSDVRKGAIRALGLLGEELAKAAVLHPVAEPYLHNLDLLCKFSMTLWSSSRFSPKTIRDYLTKLDTHLLRALGVVRLEELDPERASEKFVEVAREYSNRDAIQPLRLLENFMRLEPPNGLGKDLCINWKHRGFIFPKEYHTHHLVSVSQFEQVLEMLRSHHAGDILRAVAILSYFAGLRANEVAKLQCWNWRIGSKEVHLWVEHSKTRNGRRNLPLHLLVPRNYREEILALLPSDHRNNPDQYYCLKPDGKGPYSSGHLGKEVSRCLKVVVDRDSSHHTLRASFINITFLRLLCAAWGKHCLGKNLPLFSDPRFSKDGLIKARWLLDGSGDLREGSYTLASRVTAALALLSGHGSRKITFENYVHVHDWIQRSFVNAAALPAIPRLSKVRLAMACFSYPREVGAHLAQIAAYPGSWIHLRQFMESLSLKSD